MCTNIPQDITREIPLRDSGVTTVGYPEPGATDNCGGQVTLQSRSHAPGDSFPVGTTRVSYTFVDDSGNAVTCGFNVQVIEGNFSYLRTGILGVCC